MLSRDELSPEALAMENRMFRVHGADVEEWERSVVGTEFMPRSVTFRWWRRRMRDHLRRRELPSTGRGVPAERN